MLHNDWTPKPMTPASSFSVAAPFTRKCRFAKAWTEPDGGYFSRGVIL